MARATSFALVVAALLAAGPVTAFPQQPTVVVQKPDAQKPETTPPVQTEADKKLSEIMKGTGGRLDSQVLVPQLEQFMRDNPAYPRMQRVYSYLLMFTSPTSNPDKALALADEASAKFPDDSSIRASAFRLKFGALRAQKNEDGIKELGRRLLDAETNPSVLQAAAQYDRANALKLAEKAIAEREKIPSATAAPLLDDLRWTYAQRLTEAGRKDEAAKLQTQVLDQAKKDIAELQALPKDDPKRSRLTMLQMNVGSRYSSLATTLSEAGDYQKALEYVALAEQSGDNPLEAVGRYEQLRAGIYAKMGRPDLELDSYAKAYAARMDVTTRDKIRALAPKAGKKPEEVFARAREFRNANATAISPFDLKTLDGQPITLDGVRAKAKVTLVNFFFPT